MTKLTKIFDPTTDQKAIDQIENCLRDERAIAGALMADAHLGYSMPIGGVITYDGAISPTGVGFDIACGNMAVKTSALLSDFANSDGGQYAQIKKVMREVQRNVSFGMGRSNPKPVDDAIFYNDLDTWEWLEAHSPGLTRKAEQQLGTVGSGNHYVDLLVDEQGYVWIANHFGSRGFGHTIASGFMALAAGVAFNERVPEGEDAVVLNLSDEIGLLYTKAMNLAGEYAYAGRRHVIDQVLEILGNPKVLESVHNHHNFAWEETPGQWTIRKGATPLTIELAFIGGSMGDVSVIVRGRPHKGPLLRTLGTIQQPWPIEDIGALHSAPHGAGRIMGRNQAAGKVRKYWVCPNRNCEFVPIRCTSDASGHPANHCPLCSIPLRRERMRDTTDARINWDEVRADLVQRNIVVLGAGADEAPGVYKSLEYVLAQHSNIEVVHRLMPIGVVMAGADEYDPYKD